MKPAQAKISKELLTSSRIPQAYWTKGEEHYIGLKRVAWDQCLKYIREFNSIKKEGLGIVFVGSSGSQKTFLMSFILKQLLIRDNLVRYCTCTEIADIVFHHKEEYKDLGFGETFLAPAIIGIDDLEPLMIPAVREVTLRTLKMRADTGYPILVATRQSQDHWDAVFGSDIARILTDTCLQVDCVVDEVEKSLRVQTKKEKYKV